MSLSGIGCIQSKLHTFQPSITSNCLIESNEKMKFNNKNYYSHICSNYKKLLPMKSCNPLITGDILLDLSSYDISTYLKSFKIIT
ncbi:unnamed protein product [Heterobilharzia americana]|nr:unnamed protein product [Heterobilharzia americana]